MSELIHVQGIPRCVMMAAATPAAGFFDVDCYRHFRLRMAHCRPLYRLQIHAYVLLPMEVWLLTTPLCPRSIYNYCAFLNRSYSEYFNSRFRREVRVWRAEPRVSLLADDARVLECQKFIERQPLEQRLVPHPGRHAWSSFCATGFGGVGDKEELLSIHPAVRQFIAKKRLAGYRDYVMAPFPPGRLADLRGAFEQGVTPPSYSGVGESQSGYQVCFKLAA